MFLLKDTYSTDARSPEEVTAWTTEAYPGFTCATLYSPATVIFVRDDEAGARLPVPPMQNLVDARLRGAIFASELGDAQTAGALVANGIIAFCG